MRTTSRTGAAGFTLIEIIVAVIVFTIAMALALPVITNVTGLAHRAAGQAAASGEARLAVQMLEADLRHARGLTRSDTDRTEMPDNTLLDVASGAATDHDLQILGPNVLRFYADVLSLCDVGCVDPAAGPELVTYALMQDSRFCDLIPGGTSTSVHDNWCIVRSVQVLRQNRHIHELLAHGSGAYPSDSTCYPGAPRSPRLFCYRSAVPASWSYTWAGWTPRCAMTWSEPQDRTSVDWNTNVTTGYSWNAGGGIAVQRTPAPATSQLFASDRVVQIGLVTHSASRNRSARGSETFTTHIAVRNRMTPEYMRAIGCGER